MGFFGSGQRISEVDYLERPHFRIVTKTAIYLYDRAGGGFSSIKDRKGIEWIGYQPGDGKVPESAASDFRGMPNLVFRGEDNGAGHPGFNQCLSEKIGKRKIRTKSISGEWIWEWTFNQSGALLEVLKIDSTRNYWFLYEGIPGGKFDPSNQFWGNDKDSIRYDTPPLKADSIAKGLWDWTFFGHNNSRHILVIIQLTPDSVEDNFSYMGSTDAGIHAKNGMVVLGLGRLGSQPLMNTPNQFYIGFYRGDPEFERIQEYVGKIIQQK